MQSVDHQLYLAESHRIPKLSISRYIQYFNINVKPFLEQCMVEHTIQGYEVYRFRLTGRKARRIRFMELPAASTS
ncbi:hypothetical protein [Paenibacillus sp. ALE2]